MDRLHVLGDPNGVELLKMIREHVLVTLVILTTFLSEPANFWDLEGAFEVLIFDIQVIKCALGFTFHIDDGIYVVNRGVRIAPLFVMNGYLTVFEYSFSKLYLRILGELLIDIFLGFAI